MEDDGAVAASQGLSLGQGISGWVAQTGQSVRLGDVRQDPRYYPVRENIRSELCVPLRYGDRILGVVNVETPTPDAYTGADERVLETVAAQMAVAIANAQLFDQVQRQAAELEERVARRTAELAAINEQLQCEVLERRRAEEALLRSHRALQTLSECNHVLAYAESESDLLQYICRIVVEIGGYRLAWVGFAEHDAARTVRPVAQAGFEEGYLETLDITWADCERGRGPTGTAIRTGQPTPSREIQTDPRFAPWRAEAIRRGYASSLALPLRTRGQILGSLNIYAAEADAFDAEETELLAEVADNLAFGIEALRARVDRQRAEEALRQRAEELSVLHAIGHQVGGSLSPEEVVQAALQGIVDTVAPDLAMLYLRQGEQMVLQGAAASEPRLQAVGPEVKRVGECLCGLAASEGRPLYSSNIAADPLCTLEECKRAGMHSFAALPLLKGADVLGVVGLGSLRERVFSEQATVLEALAGEIAIGLQNALLHQQVRRHATDLEREVRERRRAEEELASKTEELARSHAFLSALTLVSTHLQTTVDPGQVLDLLGTELRALDLTSLVALMEPGATELDLHYASVPSTVLTRIERVAGFRLQGFRVPADAWPVASAVEQRRALYVPDPLPALAGLVPGVPEPLLHRIARVLGIAPDFPAVFLPLAVEEQPIGVLAVWGADLQAVDLPALSIFAGQVAVAFERARLTREAADAEILRELARLRSELVANVSHEIRTPLGLIQVFCTSLLMDDIDLDRETQRQFLGGIRDEAERLTAIVDNLLNLGRIDSGRFRLHWRPTDLGQLTSQILPTLQSQVIEHRLVQEFPPEPLVARVDPKQIEQVLRNLLTNAIHYSPGGGLVTVEGQRQGRQVVLCVRDEGIGIPAAEQERIFERFYRVDSDLT
ncbi:MAG: GAF domain-containing protein, partial [Candidatus Hermodarchaeota archaeon]